MHRVFVDPQTCAGRRQCARDLVPGAAGDVAAARCGAPIVLSERYPPDLYVPEMLGRALVGANEDSDNA